MNDGGGGGGGGANLFSASEDYGGRFDESFRACAYVRVCACACVRACVSAYVCA